MKKTTKTTKKLKGDITQIPMVAKPKREWYEFVTPVLGIKWGATVTLVGYTWLNHSDSDGLKLACIIVTAFLFIEWAQMAWREFKYRGQK
jgi:hypothetical protein